MTRRLTFRDLHEMAIGRPCMWCSTPMHSVHIHHVNHDHTDNRINNLSIICESCHRIHHSENGSKMTGKYERQDSEPPIKDLLLPATFHEAIRQYRKAKQLSITTTAGLIGVSPSTLSRWERGRVNPPADGIGSLADVLGFHIDTLLNRRGAA